MKKVVSLLLAAALLLLGVAALAEGAYVPGVKSDELIKAALKAGQIVTMDVNMSLDADPAALGVDEDNAATVSAMLALLKNAHLKMGVGKIDSGVRVEMAGELYAPDASASVGVSGAANLTWDGVSLESNVIPGKRVTIGTQTILAAMGMDQPTIDAVMGLRGKSVPEIAAIVLEKLSENVEESDEHVETYMAILIEHLSALTVERSEQTQEGEFPAAAHLAVVRFTGEEVASLISALIDQAESDLRAADQMTEQAAKQFASYREDVEKIRTSGATGCVALGRDEKNTPSFVVARVNRASGERVELVASGSVSGDPTLPGSMIAADLSANLLDAGGNAIDGLTFAMTVMTSEDPVLSAGTDAAMTMEALVDGQNIYNLAFTGTTAGEMKDDLPTSKTQASEVVTMDMEGDTLRTVSAVEGVYGLTAAGGEEMTVAATVDGYLDESAAFSMTLSMDGSVAPVGDGVEGAWQINLAIPSMIDTFDMAVGCTSAPYDAAATQALDELALESAGSEDLEALQQLAQKTMTEKLFSLLAVLPPEVMSTFVQVE